jgi:hypothetical protein
VSADRTDEILSAISTLADRINGLEAKVDRIDARAGTLDRIEGRLSKMESVVYAIARHTLAPAQCVALGILDARTTGSASADIPPALPRAAKNKD